MRLAAAASAFPSHTYDQQTIAAGLTSVWHDKLQRPESLDRLHRNTGVDQRHLVLPLQEYLAVDTWGKANNIWIENAVNLGSTAICRALAPLGLEPKAIDALFFVTVTGVASPSIDARLVNRMGLSPNIKRNPIFGLGCVAGVAGVARAADYVRAFPKHIAVLLSVEICSLTWQRDDVTVANVISTGLFGDGAAAVVIGGAESGLTGPQVIDTCSTFYPNTERVMGWDVSERGFQIVLSPEVPDVIEQNLRRDVDGFLAKHGLKRSDMSSWIIHTGGPKVLDAVANALELKPGELDASWDCLRRVGNLSSASVLVVLQDFLANRRGEPGTYSLMAAMGPGFCSEVVLLRW
jgi:alkylresorcinol/alkylpyrone synthase